jgi:hypothetical protein
MRKPFDRLGERLLAAGIAPRHVSRYLTELTEHLEDLRAEGDRAGEDRAQAEAVALSRLGAPDDLARAMIERPEFRSWATRTPWAAFVTFIIAPPLTLTLIFALIAFFVGNGYSWLSFGGSWRGCR